MFQYLLVRVTVFWKISSEHFQKTFNLTIYNLFWDLMLLHRKIGENNQQLKRVGKLSDWLKSSKKMYYCWQIYFATISHVVNSIHERFVQPDFKKIYPTIESFLIKNSTGKILIKSCWRSKLLLKIPSDKAVYSLTKVQFFIFFKYIWNNQKCFKPLYFFKYSKQIIYLVLFGVK